MGDRLANGLRRRGHWLGMLGGGEGQVNETEWLAASQEICWRRIAITLIERAEA